MLEKFKLPWKAIDQSRSIIPPAIIGSFNDQLKQLYDNTKEIKTKQNPKSKQKPSKAKKAFGHGILHEVDGEDKLQKLVNTIYNL